jgi:DNA-binding CsgD family transcriptional regulator
LAVDVDSFEAAFTLAEALSAQGRFEEAASTAAALEGHEPADDATAKLAHFRMLSEVLLPGGDTERARQIIDVAIERVRDGPQRDYLTATAAELAMNRTELGAAIDLADSLLARPDLDEQTCALAVHVSSLSKTMSGRPESGLAVNERLKHPSPQTIKMMPRAAAWPVLDRLLAFCYAGRLAEAVATCEAQRAVGRHGPAAGVHAELHHYQGRAELMRGRPRSAAASLRQAVAVLRAADFPGYLAWSLALLAASYALVDRPENAADLWAQSEQAADRSARRLFDPDRRLAGAWVMAGRGELSGAARVCADMGTAAADAGMIGWAVVALYDALRLGEMSIARRLADLAASCQGPLGNAVAAHAQAMISANGADLATAGEQLVAAGMLLAAAEAYTQASHAYTHSGHRALATAATARARVLAGECEGARTPILATVSSSHTGLTRREHEIAELAARGSSNRDIASRLFVSVRTVEGHLLHAFAKLGITNRAELPAALGLTPTSDTARM